MARALKTYTTSIGFFDLAVAAPSMKAALEAWGVRRNLFHEGTASETDEPAIVEATMNKPGVVLKRAIGTNKRFEENAELPAELPTSASPKQAHPPKPRRRPKAQAPSVESKKAQKAAVIQFDKEKARREREHAREEAVRAKREASDARRSRERQEEADRIQAQVEKARERYERTLADIQKQHEALDRKSDAEKKRWYLKKERLEHQLKTL